MSKTTVEKTKQYPVDCDHCDVAKELKGKWTSGQGMTFSIYQCPECKDIDIYMADEPLTNLEGLCPRCGSQNTKLVENDYECPDCGLIFRERKKH